MLIVVVMMFVIPQMPDDFRLVLGCLRDFYFG